MESRWTTRCCSAVALTFAIVMSAAEADAQLPRSVPSTAADLAKRLVSPFPTRTHWMIALNNALIAPPAYAGSVGYFPIEGDRITAYDLVLGKLLWIASARPQSAPIVVGDLLVIEQAGRLTALRTSDGSKAWEVPLGDPLIGSIESDGGRLFGATKTALLAARAADGSLLWRRDLGAPPHGSPSPSGNHVYLASEDGHVRAYRLDNGEPVWERRVGGIPTEILALADRLYVGSTDNFLRCLFTKDGVQDWQVRTGADIVHRPIYDSGRVFFVSLDNLLRALDPKSGAQLWKRSLTFRPVWPLLKAADTIVVAGIVGPPRAFYMKDGVPAGDMTTMAPATAPLQWVDVILPPNERVTLSPLMWPIIDDPFEAVSTPAASAPAPTPTPLSSVIGGFGTSGGFGTASTPVTPTASLTRDTGPVVPGGIDSTSELAAPPYAFPFPGAFGPAVVAVTRSLLSGARVIVMSRQVEPLPLPMAPLLGVQPVVAPNIVSLGEPAIHPLEPGELPGAVPIAAPPPRP